MRATRVLLGAAGVAIAAYGVSLLLDLGFANLRATLEWLVGGVLLHDAVLAPLTIVVGAVFVRARRAGLRIAPLVIGGVVLASVSIAAIPVLGRFGERADNATLLDRNYLVGWLVFAGVTVAVSLVLLVRGRQRP
ncbi:hypothetical protein [Nocardioides marmorisolisilvae]|uniref:Uncharacterized protein n=1 Tax=Nocardioides marmorisolisilvae TaxID=1542737 RepID=A0A3N0DTQ6_9ACTN|nr:hypothetical protein [Nocardioides marmorisolisilvae]RNL79002.1 hypothetical protein EFL95_08125 [Nocardioides marmorisolisilvae]